MFFLLEIYHNVLVDLDFISFSLLLWNWCLLNLNWKRVNKCNVTDPRLTQTKHHFIITWMLLRKISLKTYLIQLNVGFCCSDQSTFDFFYLKHDFIAWTQLFCHLLGYNYLNSSLNVFDLLLDEVSLKLFRHLLDLFDNLFWLVSWRKGFVHLFKDQVRIHVLDNFHLRRLREILDPLKIKNTQSFNNFVTKLI